MEFSGFDWDEGNSEKCAKHGLSRAAIQRLFTRGVKILPDHTHSASEQRLRAIGRTGAGRYVFVVFTLRHRDGNVLVRPISARYMHKKEADHYAKIEAEEDPGV